jgi:ABC-type multidrug transport system fused ATPase/permease subunit
MRVLLLLTASLFGVYLLANILDYFREYFEWKELYYDLERFIRLDTLTQLSRFSIGQHSNEHSGLRQSTINQGKDAVRRLSEHFTYTLFPMLLQVTLATAVILLTNWQVGVVILIASLLYIYLLFTHNMRFYPLMKKNTDDFQKLVKKESEIIRHFSLIKAEAQEQSIIKEYFDGVIPVEEFGKQIWIGHSKVYHSYQAFIELAQVGALFMGIVLVTQGYTTPGTVVALFGWISSVFGNLGNIGWMQRQVIQQVASIDRYMETLSLPVAIQEKPNAITLPTLKGTIAFENVFFSYPIVTLKSDTQTSRAESQTLERETLKGVSFSINAGETVALVGHSGAGKTTIIQLILRGYDPQSGVVRIDGHDLKDIALAPYLNNIGYVEQNVRLFDGTLRENIVFGLPDKTIVTDLMLDEVAKKARIDQFYDRLGKEKFEAKIGENGIWLSGGERQRVGIARALIKNPQILIFDEATSSLDAENEALIHEAMREALKGRTGIIIAHRLSTIKDANKIIVIEKGVAIDIGTHKELLKRCEVYSNLVNRQLVKEQFI